MSSRAGASAAGRGDMAISSRCTAGAPGGARTESLVRRSCCRSKGEMSIWPLAWKPESSRSSPSTSGPTVTPKWSTVPPERQPMPASVIALLSSSVPPCVPPSVSSASSASAPASAWSAASASLSTSTARRGSAVDEVARARSGTSPRGSVTRAPAGAASTSLCTAASESSGGAARRLDAFTMTEAASSAPAISFLTAKRPSLSRSTTP
mmetsp:Transcript_65052/g.156954  ORF Transcript_65052/g.156954 Transcript_65052/m.156954 type:complete len:209 (-) Transcript_65052:325-951(-)